MCKLLLHKDVPKGTTNQLVYHRVLSKLGAKGNIKRSQQHCSTSSNCEQEVFVIPAGKAEQGNLQ